MLAIAALLVACNATPEATTPKPAPPAAPPAPAHESPDDDAHEGGAHHDKHGDKHGDDHATVTHRFDDADKWAKVFDDPERDAWQKPAELVAALQIAPGSTVADVGAGTGYFNPYLSRAVGAEGRVIAVDIEASLVEHMTARASKDGTPNVEARLGKAHNPALKPNEVDLILLVDTYHHIDDRTAYFGRLREAVTDGGRLVIVDFGPGDIPVGPPEDHRIPEAKVVQELEAAGWSDQGSRDVLEYQFVHVFEVSTRRN